MKQYIPLQMAITNDLGDQVKPEELYRFIETNSEGIQTYWIDPEKVRDKNFFAAIDYVTLIAIGGTFVTIVDIAKLLWEAYQRFISEKKQSQNDGLGLYIHLPDGTDFWLGKEYLDQDVFIRRFSTRIAELQQQPGDIKETTTEVITMVQNSDVWTRRK